MSNQLLTQTQITNFTTNSDCRKAFIAQCKLHMTGEVQNFEHWEMLNELSEEFCSFEVWERFCGKYNFS